MASSNWPVLSGRTSGLSWHDTHMCGHVGASNPCRSPCSYPQTHNHVHTSVIPKRLLSVLAASRRPARLSARTSACRAASQLVGTCLKQAVGAPTWLVW